MAVMTSADVTYAQQDAQIKVPGRVSRKVLLTFPNNGVNNQYPQGGVPLNRASLGCPRSVDRIKVLGRFPSAGDTNVIFEWNGSTNGPTLLGFEVGAAAATPLAQMDSATTFGTNSILLFVEVEGY